MPRMLLVVDDHSINRLLLKNMLCKDYDIIEAEDGKEALALMHNTAQLIILIRRGAVSEIPHAMKQVNSSYRDIVDAIYQYFAAAVEIKKKNHRED